MEQTLTNKELLDIKSIIQFGNRIPEDYKILFFEKVYGVDKSVRIRGLSSYEYDMIEMERLDIIKDEYTKNYSMGDPNLVFGETRESKKKETEIPIKDRKIPDYVKTGELLCSYNYRDALIVFHAMKDFYKNLTIEDVMQLEGIDEIAKRVNEKSGQDKETLDKIKFFRKESNEHGPSDTTS